MDTSHVTERAWLPASECTSVLCRRLPHRILSMSSCYFGCANSWPASIETVGMPGVLPGPLAAPRSQSEGPTRLRSSPKIVNLHVLSVVLSLV